MKYAIKNMESGHILSARFSDMAEASEYLYEYFGGLIPNQYEIIEVTE